MLLSVLVLPFFGGAGGDERYNVASITNFVKRSAFVIRSQAISGPRISVLIGSFACPARV